MNTLISETARLLLLVCLLAGLTPACGLATVPTEPFTDPAENASHPATDAVMYKPDINSYLPPTRLPGQPVLTPTPDSPHLLPAIRTETVEYYVQSGDTLKDIGRRFGTSWEQIAAANQIENPNLISVGQRLVIPPPLVRPMATGFKVIPDSELVNGPISAFYNHHAFIQNQNGHLSGYQEEVEGVQLTGAEIIERISRIYSINPRLLLALLEYQSGWVIQKSPPADTLEDPLQIKISWRKGLYQQLSWAADTLNLGYYLWKVNGFSAWALKDGNIVPANPQVNAGTAAIQYLASQLYGYEGWVKFVSQEGFHTTFTKLFGYPFDYAVHDLLPANLTQPPLQLPFEPGVVWSFTGGPHGGYGDGSAWAALDFAPPGEVLGCVQSDDWVTAMANGNVTFSNNGIVILDLDKDGYEQTGWVLFYLHVETRDRVAQGKTVEAGERLGHPSCEGGISTGTHIHIARRYNGEWISADGTLPFTLDGWVSKGSGSVYNGVLEKDGKVVEAWDERKDENQIQR